MKFKIIPNQQTPEASDTVNVSDHKLMVKFLSFARRQHNCAGLAANQVTVDGERMLKPFFAIVDNHFWDIVIYPEIIKYIGKPQTKEEGCLTWLGKTIIAERYPSIEVRYMNLKKIENIYETISGFKAQCWQHEYNHIKGIEEKIKGINT